MAANDGFEQLVTIIGFTNNRSSDEEVLDRLHTVKQEVAPAMSKLHRLQMADLSGWVR